MNIAINRDGPIAEALQSFSASEADVHWCSENGLESCSDLQFIAEHFLPDGAAIRALWCKLQGRPTMMVDVVVEALKVEKLAAHPVAHKSRFQQRAWLPSKRRKTAAPPATVSQDQEARVQAASAVVDLSWSWAGSGFGLGYEVPAFMADRRRVAQAKK